MALIETHDVRDDLALSAALVYEDRCFAGSGEKSPSLATRILLGANYSSLPLSRIFHMEPPLLDPC